jgi:small subunit ribosomal protein S1
MNETKNDNEERSFAELLEQSLTAADNLEPGRQIDATVVRIGKEWVFLDLGGKSEGVIARSELVDESGKVSVTEGDRISAYFLSARGSELLFTTRLVGQAAHAHLEEALRSGIPVTGQVEKEVKGGFEVRIAGVRGFCPYSQMELRRVTDAGNYLDRPLEFRIIEIREGGRNIILSRRAILEEEQRQKKEKLRETLAVGQTVKGTIISIRNFGAFVDIGGVEGLIPISEISWGRVDDIRGLLNEGQQVEVAIVKLDWEGDRFTFSLRETLPDPWDNIRGRYSEGSVHKGAVARLANFGAFVTLEPGIDGLLHISSLGGGRRINHPREVVKEGEEIEVRIDAIDEGKKRLSLVLAAATEESGEKGRKPRPSDEKKDDYRQYLKEAKNEAGRTMGTLGDLLQSKLAEKKGKKK